MGAALNCCQQHIVFEPCIYSLSPPQPHSNGNKTLGKPEQVRCSTLRLSLLTHPFVLEVTAVRMEWQPVTRRSRSTPHKVWPLLERLRHPSQHMPKTTLWQTNMSTTLATTTKSSRMERKGSQSKAAKTRGVSVNFRQRVHSSSRRWS